jgi:hypothetical protein
MKLKLIEALHQLLARVPKLVDQYEAKRTDFPGSVKQWLVDSEKILMESGRPQVAEIAGLRSFVTAAEEGIFEASFNIPEHTPRYKARAAVGVQVLSRAMSVLQDILKPEENLIDKARQVLKQALVMVDQKGAITPKKSKKKKTSPYPEEIWRRLWDTDDTSTMMRHVLTLVPYEDVRTLTGQVIEEWFSMVK